MVPTARLRAAVAHFAAGFAYGGALIGAGVGVIAVCGGLHITGVRLPPGLLADLGWWVVIAVGQELVFRGLLLGALERWTGSWPAIVVSGVGYGAIHLVQPHASPAAAAALAVDSLGAYAGVWMLTRSLSAVIGVHLAWNLVLASILGLRDSGQDYAGVVVAGLHGPPWLTGGAFGPEASLTLTYTCASAGAILLWIAHRRGCFRPAARSFHRASRGDHQYR